MSGWTKTHMCMSIEGALRNKAFLGFTDDNGRELSKEEAEAELLRMKALGHRVLPLADCEGFDYQTGCPGHPDTAPAPRQDKGGEA